MMKAGLILVQIMMICELVYICKPMDISALVYSTIVLYFTVIQYNEQAIEHRTIKLFFGGFGGFWVFFSNPGQSGA